ncbi:MAG: methylmalonyl-CoA mutase family protein [Myxococcota bacterium]|nr:methylmalonyl-CoA mutase family protein [Myxococcota bacterium]
MSTFKSITKEEWIAKIQKERKGADPSGILHRKTLDGFFLDILHTTAEPANISFPDSSRWIKCQEYGMFTPQALNQCLLRDLQGGCDGALIRLDSGLASGEAFVGDGTSLWNVDGWDQALDGVYLEGMPLHIESGSAAFCVGATLLAWQMERKVSNVQIHYGLDPLGAFAQSGIRLESMSALYQKGKEFYEWVQPLQPESRIFRVSSEPYHMAGACRTRELSIILATIAEYLRHLEISPQELSKQLTLYLPMGRDIFENIAVLRSIRMLYSHMFDACGVKATPYIHAKTSQRMLSIYDPWVNMLRSTTAGFSAAVGKADSISISPYDARLATDTELGARVARNTHHLLSDECHLDQLFDPGLGSYYIENYTHTLSEKAWEAFQTIESRGGLYAMLRKRSVRALLEEDWRQRKKRIVTGKMSIIGCNLYPQPEEKPVISLANTADETRRQSEYYFARGASPTIGGSTLPSIIPLFHEGLTTNELMDGIFFYKKKVIPPLPVHYDAEPFEKLRALPSQPIPLLKIGSEAQWSARAQFAEQFLCSGGIACSHHILPFEDNLHSILECSKNVDSAVICICGPDGYYTDNLISSLRSYGKVLVVGRPSERAVQPWKYMYRGCNMVELLQSILSETT